MPIIIFVTIGASWESADIGKSFLKVWILTFLLINVLVFLISIWITLILWPQGPPPPLQDEEQEQLNSARNQVQPKNDDPATQQLKEGGEEEEKKAENGNGKEQDDEEMSKS